MAAIERQAFMSIESGGNFGFGFSSIRQGGSELGAATLTHAQVCGFGDNDAELALCHGSSLPLYRGGNSTCGFQTAPLPEVEQRGLGIKVGISLGEVEAAAGAVAGILPDEDGAGDAHAGGDEVVRPVEDGAAAAGGVAGDPCAAAVCAGCHGLGQRLPGGIVSLRGIKARADFDLAIAAGAAGLRQGLSPSGVVVDGEAGAAFDVEKHEEDAALRGHGRNAKAGQQVGGIGGGIGCALLGGAVDIASLTSDGQHGNAGGIERAALQRVVVLGGGGGLGAGEVAAPEGGRAVELGGGQLNQALTLNLAGDGDGAVNSE